MEPFSILEELEEFKGKEFNLVAKKLVKPSSTLKSSWVDSSYFEYFVLKVLSARTTDNKLGNYSMGVEWSFDGYEVHGVEDRPSKYIKGRYFRLVYVNTEDVPQLLHVDALLRYGE
jgi:hypothetical protein